METWLQQFVRLLPEGSSYYLILLLIAFGESLPIIGLLLPGSTLIVLAGFLAFHGKGLLLPIFFCAAGGALLGDLLGFWLGRHFGERILALKSFQKRRQLAKQAERFFYMHGGKSIFFARFLGPIRGITPFFAGISRMPGRPFGIYAFISAILWGIVYPGLGFLGGISWQRTQSLTTRAGLLVLLILGLTIIHYWLRRSLKLSSGDSKHGD
ncbi:MAG: DedA family protein [Deltaproteobacteria bacterium]|nr:DedA family protein [Deltaproteobacteria bacterium]